MRPRIETFHALGRDQARAADPNVHAALSASAGTGKTQVLTARVLRLLLGGTRPETILCLTFTKAGAAEMANRIGARLAAWVRMRDQDLRTDLTHIGERNDPQTMQRARRLFAGVLDAPGGLRIQTIHSFAQALLAAFPAEAGIVPGFRPIEQRAEQELARTTLAELLSDAEKRGDERLIGDVQCLSLRMGEKDAVAYLMRCARRAEVLAKLGPADEIEPLLCRLLGLPDEDIDQLIAARCSDESFDCDLLKAVAAANRQWPGVTGAGHVERIERWLALASDERARQLPDLALVVFTGSGEPRKVTAGQTRIDPDYQHRADVLAGAIGELVDIQRRAQLVRDMAAGLRAGQAFAAAYTRAKRSAGLADFDDLIAWTRRLLAKPGMGDWVRYKLDRQTDHILVDEAQDTNRGQWEIVDALASEYFSGSSEAEHRVRTLFMVGDFKQAIYGFQGTDPREFEDMRKKVRERSAALRATEDEADDGQRLALDYREVSISASFRSTQAVLDVVDAVIDEVGHRKMGLEKAPPPHLAFHDERQGLVELWKPFAAETEDGAAANDDGEEGWIAEDDRLYAAALANRVKAWLDEAPVLASTSRPLTPGDILILVRSRGELASLIVARLFAAGVPVAGLDRLHLHEPFAVRDLLAAVRFAVQPLDDLNLANLLVSPLIGWTQEQLMELAANRGGTPLWKRLVERSREGAPFAAAREALGGLLAMADFATPARFFETILSGPLDGRRKLYRRLGLAARDPIDELLTNAIEYERGETPSLERFLAWFGRGDFEVQRDPSAPTNAVRVMTVHGAKGLEAPYVILADATTDPAKLGGVSSVVDLPIGDVGNAPVIRPRKAERVSPFDEVMADQDKLDLQEHWRLLYVGLTRAKERLVIAGLDKGKIVEGSWHAMVTRALVALGAQPDEDSEWGEILRYRGTVAGRPPKAKRDKLRLEPPAIPDWARTPAPPEARPPRPLAPSALADDGEAAPPPSAALKAAAERGTLIHLLLERLADVAADNRHKAALGWLERSAGVADETLRREIADTACAVLSDPSFAPLFGPGSLGEAPLAAALPDGRVIAGTVDRLLVEEGRVSVIDYKTGRVPESDSAIPPSHRAQMLAYTEALQVIFPGRKIRAALLYTGGPRLFELTG